MDTKLSEKNIKVWQGVVVVTDPTWGDNGKGKIVDLLSSRAQMSIRYNGGPNAGHTVRNEFGEFKFHLIPSAIFNPDCLCIIANTVVIDPIKLAEEILALRKAGIAVTAKNLLIGQNAHLIMPWHRKRDIFAEKIRSGGQIGTTGKGIGPTYADRTQRLGLQMWDLVGSGFEKKFAYELDWQEKLISLMEGSEFHFDKKEVYDQMLLAKEILAPLTNEVLEKIDTFHQKEKRILGEAGQGALLDLDLGTYPFVTSSHPGIVGFNLATAIPVKSVYEVVAVTKAYTTRVGAGPMPTEDSGEVGEKIRTIGKEFGTTTGRPRRCGWLDIPALAFGAKVAGADSLAMTKLDIFDDFDEIQICVGYELKGQHYAKISHADAPFLQDVIAVMETLPGWRENTTQIREYEKLPKNAKVFIEKIEKLVKIPIKIVSVGADRIETIWN